MDRVPGRGVSQPLQSAFFFFTLLFSFFENAIPNNIWIGVRAVAHVFICKHYNREQLADCDDGVLLACVYV